MIEITAKSILRVRARPDAWFVSRTCLNLYRGCAHDCAYCDGRAETYRAPDNFAGSIEVKTNALEVLARELARFAGVPAEAPVPDGQLSLFSADDRQAAPRKRAGFVTLGGGVGDQYQPLEEHCRLARGTLELCLRFLLPVHLLTKSVLPLRDLDLLLAVNAASRAVVSVSLATLDPALAAIVEPGAAAPEARLDMLRTLSSRGIVCGVFMLPLLPFLSDTDEEIEKIVAAAADAGASFVMAGGLTLKPGRQMEHYLGRLDRDLAAAAAPTRRLYARVDRNGQPVTSEAWRRWAALQTGYRRAAARHAMACRMPWEIFAPLFEPATALAIAFDQMDQLLKMDNRTSSFGRAAGILLQNCSDDTPDRLDEPARTVARELLLTGTSATYDSVVRPGQIESFRRTGGITD